MNIRTVTPQDNAAIARLYRAVAASPGGLARLEHEISDEYIEHFMTCATARGIELVAEGDNGQIIGEVHAYAPQLFCFAHVLSDLTLAIHPDFQGQGIGRRLLSDLLEYVSAHMPEILRVELIARQSNAGAIRLYESLGFTVEGEFRGRIRNLDGSLESDIPMAWTRR